MNFFIETKLYLKIIIKRKVFLYIYFDAFENYLQRHFSNV